MQAEDSRVFIFNGHCPLGSEGIGDDDQDEAVDDDEDGNGDGYDDDDLHGKVL